VYYTRSEMRFTSIDPDNILFGEYNNRVIKVNPVQFQIPRMYMPFGVSGFAPTYGQVKYNIDFSMKGWNEPGNYVNKFYDFLMEIEQRVVSYVEGMSKEIFGYQMTREELSGLFNSNIKMSETYDPKFRVKVSDKTQFFDIADSEIDKPLEEGLYKKFSGSALVQMGNVYFFNKRFGITWTAEQVKVYEPQRLHGFQFSEPSEDEEPVEKMKGFAFAI
jgi:hypothetical protein